MNVTHATPRCTARTAGHLKKRLAKSTRHGSAQSTTYLSFIDLVLLRAFCRLYDGSSHKVCLYRISTRTDTDSDTFGQPQLTAANHQPAAKTLMLDLADAGLASVDNLEGMSWGPPLADGSSVLLVSDNNFNPAEATPFIALCQERGRCGAGSAQVYSAGLRLKSG